jgi:hypothetical protein
MALMQKQESKPGLMERSATGLRDTAAVIGLLALTGSFVIPAFTKTAIKAGLIWAGAEYTRGSIKQRRQNVR